MGASGGRRRPRRGAEKREGKGEDRQRRVFLEDRLLLTSLHVLAKFPLVVRQSSLNQMRVIENVSGQNLPGF